MEEPVYPQKPRSTVAFLCHCYRAWVTILIKSLRDAKAIRFPLLETLISFLSLFLSVHNPFRARECLRGQRTDTLSSSKNFCMHPNESQSIFNKKLSSSKSENTLKAYFSIKSWLLGLEIENLFSKVDVLKIWCFVNQMIGRSGEKLAWDKNTTNVKWTRILRLLKMLK